MTDKTTKRQLVILSLIEPDAIKLNAFLSTHAPASDERLQKIKSRILNALIRMDKIVERDSEQKEALAVMQQEEGSVKEE